MKIIRNGQFVEIAIGPQARKDRQDEIQRVKEHKIQSEKDMEELYWEIRNHLVSRQRTK